MTEPLFRLQNTDDRLMINECFFYFKHLYNDMIKNGGKADPQDAKQALNAKPQLEDNKS